MFYFKNTLAFYLKDESVTGDCDESGLSFQIAFGNDLRRVTRVLR